MLDISWKLIYKWQEESKNELYTHSGILFSELYFEEKGFAADMPNRMLQAEIPGTFDDQRINYDLHVTFQMHFKA